MTFRQQSSGVRSSEALTFRAEAATLACSRGTILGREVVPEVCRIRAVSSASGAVVSHLSPAVSVDSVKVPEMISYLSDHFELAPGDVILSGTPAGVGPITRGDVMELSIEGLGSLKIPVV